MEGVGRSWVGKLGLWWRGSGEWAGESLVSRWAGGRES